MTSATWGEWTLIFSSAGDDLGMYPSAGDESLALSPEDWGFGQAEIDKIEHEVAMHVRERSAWLAELTESERNPSLR